MKIQYASDLHLEFKENSQYIEDNPLQITGDILVLAGDIGYIGDNTYSVHPFWDWASKNYREVIVIPGNHEFYRLYDIDTLYSGWELKIRKNIKCYYNKLIHLDQDIDLIATTLWAHIPMQEAFTTELHVADFHNIRYGMNPLDANRFNDEHYRCFRFLAESLKQSTAKHKIVMTHHVPSFELVASQYKGSPINGAFTVELGDFIANSDIEYWIYGHSHCNINGTIGKTHCISNQLGYVRSGEHLTFDHGKFIEI